MRKYKLILYDAQINRMKEVIQELNVYEHSMEPAEKLTHAVLLNFSVKLNRKTEFQKQVHKLTLEMPEAIALSIFWSELDCRKEPYDLGIQQYLLGTINL